MTDELDPAEQAHFRGCVNAARRLKDGEDPIDIGKRIPRVN